jgi:hypothetical protein
MSAGFINRVEYIADANGYRILSRQQVNLERSSNTIEVNTNPPFRPETSSPWKTQLARSPMYTVSWSQPIPATKRTTTIIIASPSSDWPTPPTQTPASKTIPTTLTIATTPSPTKLVKPSPIRLKATAKITTKENITSKTAPIAETIPNVDVPVEYAVDYR